MSKVTFDIIRDLLPGARSYADYVSGLCPFHDDKQPSLLVYKDGYFSCLGCGVFGNYEKLYRKLKGIDATRVISTEKVFTSPYLPTDLREQEELVEQSHEALMKFSQLAWYIENRGVGNRIEPNRLGYYKGWYTIPIYSRYGAYQGVVLRAGSEIQKVSGMRFVQPKGQKPMMYCPDWRLLETCKTIAVVFGMFDALALADLRFAVVTPIGGQLHFNPLWLEPFRKSVVIIPDKGEEVSATKLAGRLGWRSKVLKLNYPSNAKDPAGYLETGQRDLLHSQIGGLLSG